MARYPAGLAWFFFVAASALIGCSDDPTDPDNPLAVATTPSSTVTGKQLTVGSTTMEAIAAGATASYLFFAVSGVQYGAEIMNISSGSSGDLGINFIGDGTFSTGTGHGCSGTSGTWSCDFFGVAPDAANQLNLENRTPTLNTAVTTLTFDLTVVTR
ncbi:MAG: hypothetical protein IIA14_00930 [SAR324 cluster bacterium]|nr:hypothetical protein [SAR324 cluster bacterium]